LWGRTPPLEMQHMSWVRGWLVLVLSLFNSQESPWFWTERHEAAVWYTCQTGWTCWASP
jgi:hypothetical protein